MATLIKNGLIVTGENIYPGDLLIKNGKISEIGTGTTKITEEIIDAAGRYILPGAVDASTHLKQEMYGTTTSDDFESGGRAAACGGTTTMINFACSQKGSYKRGLDEWMKQAEGKCSVDYAFHLGMTATNGRALAEIPSLVKGGITSFLFYSSNRDIILNEGQLYEILRLVAAEGGLVGIHPGSGPMTGQLEDELKNAVLPPAIAHARCRPPQVEGLAAYTALTLAELAGCPVFLMHLSTAHGLEKLKIFRDKGNPVFGETCPHYLTLTDEILQASESESVRFVASPPLRSAWHQESLWRGIRSGDIHFISSDHIPLRLEGQKLQNARDFRKIPAGLPGLENRLLVMFSFGVATGKLPLTRLVQLLSTNPAKLFGLYPLKGTISIGSDADLVILNPEGSTTVTAATHHMNVDFNPYEGMELKGVIERVFLRGRQIVKEGQFTGESGYGKYLKRTLPVLI